MEHIDLSDIKLPTGTHATKLTGRDCNGCDLTYYVVWADRPYDRCPLCREPVPRIVEDCPALLDADARQGGALVAWDQQHCCGAWLTVHWAETTFGDIAATAETLAAQLATEIGAARQQIETRLRGDLADALTRLADGEPDDDVRTGSEVHPGIYYEGAVWVAWDFDPDGSGETIAVYPTDL